MAHRILVWIDVDDDYKDTDPQITAEDYLEGSKVHSWEVVTERMFTESEVRTMLYVISPKRKRRAFHGLKVSRP